MVTIIGNKGICIVLCVLDGGALRIIVCDCMVVQYLL